MATQEKILDQLHEMDTKFRLADASLGSLRTEHGETKTRLDAIEADKKSVWLHVASVLSQIGLWGAK